MNFSFILLPFSFILGSAVAGACGFRGPYSCGAAGAFFERLRDKGVRINFLSSFRLLPLSFTKSPLSLNPSAADYRSFLPLQSELLAPSKKETVPFVGSFDTRKKKPHPASRRLFGLLGKD
jgi:hypothetical protein